MCILSWNCLNFEVKDEIKKAAKQATSGEWRRFVVFGQYDEADHGRENKWEMYSKDEK